MTQSNYEHPLTTIKKFQQAEINRGLALTAAGTLPNQSVGELLQNAEKIERWLNEPIKQKSTDSFVSASQDTNVFP